MPGTLIIAEAADGAVAPHSFELLAAGRALADQGGGAVSALVAGDESLAQPLFEHGADAVYVAPAGSLDPGYAETGAGAALAAREAADADIVLIGQTSLGRDLGPLMAFRLNTAVAMECVALTIDGGRLRATRSCYGGNANAEVTWRGDVQIATLKPKALDPLAADSSRSGSVTSIDATGEQRVRVISTEAAESTGVRLEDAEVVVSGGRGLGDPSAFGMMEELSGAARRRDRREPGGLRPGLVPTRPAGRADRQDGHAQPVHRRRDQRRQPAHGRHVGFEEHRRRQP